MRVAALYRVSTEKQETEGTSLDGQRRRFRELASAHGWEVAGEFRGQESGAKALEDRDVLQRLLACIREQPVHAVWVIEQSRLTRADKLEVALLQRELQERRIAVLVDGNRAVDLTTSEGEFAWDVTSAAYRLEWRKLRERMMAGKRERNIQGRKASGTTAYGYENPPPGHPLRGQIQIVPDEAAVVRRIFEALAAGAGLRALAEQLTAEGIPAPRGGRWGKSTLRRIIDNPVYVGTQLGGAWQKEPGSRSYKLDLKRAGAVVVEDAHEPIVSRDLWAAARAQLRGTSNGRPGMLTGLLWVNGARSWIDSTRGQSFYCPADRTPGGPWIRVDALNDLVWRAFGSLFANPDTIRRLFRASGSTAGKRETLAGELDALRAQKAKLEARLSRLIDMRADGELGKTAFEERAAATRRSIREVGESLREAAARAESAADGRVEQTIDALGLVVLAGELTADQKRRAMRALVDSVHVEAERSTKPQPKDRKGRFTGAKSQKWQAKDVFLRLRPRPEAVTSSSTSGQLRHRLTVQVVADGKVLRAPRLAGDRWAVAG